MLKHPPVQQYPKPRMSTRQRLHMLVPGLILAVSAGLSGCGNGGSPTSDTSHKNPPTSVSHTALSGQAMGGRQPIVGSAVYVYYANGSNQFNPTQIGSAVTGVDGKFSIASFNPNPGIGDLVYVVAAGGNAGGGANPNITLMSVPGIFGSGNFTGNIQINELTTAGAVSQLVNHIVPTLCNNIQGNTAPGGNCPSIGGRSEGWSAQVAALNALVNVGTGKVNPALQAASNPSQAYNNYVGLNLHASVLANCVNSAGGASGDATACGNLFQAATSGANVPTDTISASFNLLSNPASMANALFNLTPVASVYTPVPAAAPASLAVYAFEHCTSAHAGAGTSLIKNTVQLLPGFDNAQGQLSVTSNGVRSAVDFVTDMNCIAWKDASGNGRALNLGAYAFDYTMTANGNRYVATDDAEGHPGFGYLVSHANDANQNSPLGDQMKPDSMSTTVFAGGNHALHRILVNYVRDKEPDGHGIVIPAVIEWLVVAGHNHPVWAVNWRLDQLVNPFNIIIDSSGPNAYLMDSRGPYGSIGWDGKTKSSLLDEVLGYIEWVAGGHKFTMYDANGITQNSAWDYTGSGNVSYARARTVTTPIEFGLVETIAQDWYMGYQDCDLGVIVNTNSGNYIPGNHNGMTWYNSPCIWPYQMQANSNWGAPVTTKLMAWGTEYGYLGSNNVPDFNYQNRSNNAGQQLSYSVNIVWGGYGAKGVVAGTDAVSAAVSSVAAAASTTLAINGGIGSIAATAKLPGGTGSRTLGANGYNPVYQTFEISATADSADLQMQNNDLSNTLQRPVFVYANYSGIAVPVIKLDSGAGLQTLVSGTDYLVSYDTDGKRLWLTLLRDVAPGANLRLRLN